MANSSATNKINIENKYTTSRNFFSDSNCSNNWIHIKNNKLGKSSRKTNISLFNLLTIGLYLFNILNFLIFYIPSPDVITATYILNITATISGLVYFYLFRRNLI